MYKFKVKRRCSILQATGPEAGGWAWESWGPGPAGGPNPGQQQRQRHPCAGPRLPLGREDSHIRVELPVLAPTARDGLSSLMDTCINEARQKSSMRHNAAPVNTPWSQRPPQAPVSHHSSVRASPVPPPLSRTTGAAASANALISPSYSSTTTRESKSWKEPSAPLIHPKV